MRLVLDPLTIQHRMHDLPEITRCHRAQLIQRELVNVELFPIQNVLELASNGLAGNARQMHQLTEQVSPFSLSNLFAPWNRLYASAVLPFNQE